MRPLPATFSSDLKFAKHLHVTSIMPARKPRPKTTGIDQDGEYPNSIRQRNDQMSFLDLPGEIQNHMHSAVLKTCGAYLTLDLRIAMPSNWSLVSKQIHGEMLGQAMYCLTVRVAEFKFPRVITFLNRLPDRDIKLLKPRKGGDMVKKKPNAATLKIELTFPNPTDLPIRGFAFLQRWLNRFSNANKRASELEISYVGTCTDLIMLRFVSIALREILGPVDEVGKLHFRKIKDAVTKNWQEVYQYETERLEGLDHSEDCMKLGLPRCGSCMSLARILRKTGLPFVIP